MAQKYAERMSKKVVPNCDANPVDPSTEPTPYATGKGRRESGECKEHVQSTSKYFGASSENTKEDIKAHETHLVQFLQQEKENRIP